MIVESKFKPLWWLKNPHLQTLWPVVNHRKYPSGRKERMILNDGDFLDLLWFDADGPLVIVLHGLEGSRHSHYVAELTRLLHNKHFNVLFMHFRGCSGEPNKLDRSYHSGETNDLSEVILHAKNITGKPVYAAIGYSLGGNVLLKWLGENGKHSGIKHAVAVSVPYVLSDAARRMSKGVSQIYQNYLLKKLIRSYSTKFRNRPSPLNIDTREVYNFESFDDQITAPLHGFKGSEEYYELSSSRQYLKQITTHTLLIHSEDDPFMFRTTIPGYEELSSSTTLELAKYGGHVGFISGRIKPQRWLEQRILEFIN